MLASNDVAATYSARKEKYLSNSGVASGGGLGGAKAATYQNKSKVIMYV